MPIRYVDRHAFAPLLRPAQNNLKGYRERDAADAQASVRFGYPLLEHVDKQICLSRQSDTTYSLEGGKSL